MEKSDVATIIVIGIVAIFLGIPILQGSVQPLIVLSSSMEPVMSPGDMILVRKTPPGAAERGDIIAFDDPSGRADVLITHRVIDITQQDEGLEFVTKGDAVEERDPFVVKETDFVGEVFFQIPWMGYLFHYGRNTYVFVAMIVVPAVLIIAGETRNVLKYADPVKARKIEREETREERKPDRKKVQIKILRLGGILLITLIVFGMISFPCLMKSGRDVKVEKVEPGILSTVVRYTQEDNSIPRYEIVTKKDNEELELGQVSSLTLAPHIIPTFWTGVLGEIDPKLPSLATFLAPPILLTLILTPVWRRTSRRDRSRRK